MATSKAYQASCTSAQMGEFRTIGFAVKKKTWDAIDRIAKQKNLNKATLLRPVLDKFVRETIEAQKSRA